MDGIDETTKGYFKTLRLDVDYYQSFLDDSDIPEDKKRELIETLWAIMVQFVDMGIGIHPLQHADDDADNKLHPEVIKMIADAANTNENENENLKEAWPERTDV